MRARLPLGMNGIGPVAAQSQLGTENSSGDPAGIGGGPFHALVEGTISSFTGYSGFTQVVDVAGWRQGEFRIVGRVVNPELGLLSALMSGGGRT